MLGTVTLDFDGSLFILSNPMVVLGHLSRVL